MIHYLRQRKLVVALVDVLSASDAFAIAPVVA